MAASVTIKMTGSDEALRAAAAKMQKVGAGKLALAIAHKVAPVLQELGDRPWQRRASVEGEQWAPRKRRYYHPLLEKTGKTRRSLKSRARGTNVVTSVSTPYARFHQSGTRKMVARSFFPVGDALPSVWTARIRKTINDSIESALRG
jgi:phage gpG-like protein